MRFEPLGREGVLYAHARQEIHGLNAPAAFVWRALERGLPPGAAAAEYAARFGGSRRDAAHAVAGLRREWLARGWILRAPALPARRPAALRRYRLLGTTFGVRFGTRAQLERVHAALAHLEVEGPAPCEVALDLVAQPAGHRVLADGHPIESCAALEELTPLVKASLWRLAANRRRYAMQIHAAALLRGGRCALLPGAPGSGKSTLAAALLAAGFRYLSDEAALLEEPRLEVRAVPLALTLKPGSLALLEPRFPGVTALAPHRREDGKIVRYLAPPAASLADPDRTHPVSTLLFPRVAERAALRPIPRPEALRRLLAQCLVLPERLDPERVRNLVAWLRGLRCYELATGPLPQAVAAVRRAHG
jgi:hypothetical protein